MRYGGFLASFAYEKLGIFFAIAPCECFGPRICIDLGGASEVEPSAGVVSCMCVIREEDGGKIRG